MILFFSCSDHKTGMIGHITELEDSLKNNMYTPKLNRENIYILRELYVEFAKKYPEDSLTAKYIFSLAQSYVGSKKYDKAIENLDALCNRYPNSKIAPKAMFYKAFIYWDNIKQEGKAKEIFKEFISKFPNHPLSADAQASVNIIENQTSIEELIKENS